MGKAKSSGKWAKYPETVESGIPWLGPVPADWPVQRLRPLLQLNPSAREIQRSGGVQEASFLPMEAIGEQGQLDLSRVRPIDEVIASYSYFRDGDVAVAKVTPCFENGKGALLRGLQNGIGFGTTELTVLRTRPGLNPKYLYYVTASSVVRRLGVASMTGAGGLKRVKDDFFLNLYWPIPSDSEQTAICQYLDRELPVIDLLIAKQARLIDLLTEKRQSVITRSVSEGLDRNVAMAGVELTFLRKAPAHWKSGTLTKFIGPVVDYRGRTPTKAETGMFLVTARNIKDGVIDYEASQEFVDPEEAKALLKRGRPEIGDVLFTMEAPLGQVAQIDRQDIALAQRIVKFRGKEGILRNSFLMYWLKNSYCQAQLATLATGSTALGIKASKLGQIECLIPPADEQDDIVNHIRTHTAKIDALIAKCRRAIELLGEHRASLISAVVTGKIRVTENAPAAKELLAA